MPLDTLIDWVEHGRRPGSILRAGNTDSNLVSMILEIAVGRAPRGGQRLHPQGVGLAGKILSIHQVLPAEVSAQLRFLS